MAVDTSVFRDMDPAVGGGVDRDKLPASAFVFPETRTFPVVIAGDVSDAVSSWGRYKGKESFDSFKSKLTTLAKRKGFQKSLPANWQDEDSKKAGEIWNGESVPMHFDEDLDGDGGSWVFDEPSVGSVHVDAPMGNRRKPLSFAYLNKLKELCTTEKGSGITSEKFDEMVRRARGHAGGKGKKKRGGPATADDMLGTVKADETHGFDYLTPVSEPDWAHSEDDDADTCTGACCDGCNCVGDVDGGDGCSCDDCDCGETEPDRDADDIPGLEKADPRVNYRLADVVGQQCSQCRFMCTGDGDGDADDHECIIVEGWIDANSVCNLFSPQVGGTTAIASSESMTFSWDKWNQEHKGDNFGPEGKFSSEAALGGGAVVKYHADKHELPSGTKKLSAGFVTKNPDGSYHAQMNNYRITHSDHPTREAATNHIAEHYVPTEDHAPQQPAGTPKGYAYVTTGKTAKSAYNEQITGALDFTEACSMGVESLEHTNGWAYFNDLTDAFTEPPARMAYLPKPGVYKSQKYGDVKISPQRNARFVENFKRAVYQKALPIDAEHETKLSGALGWVTGMEQNRDGSVDALVDWTDRGKAMIESDRFRYFSPEFFDTWRDPATGEVHHDVAVGGAMTTRPFFKESSLKSIVMTERGLTIMEGDMEQVFGEDKNKKPKDADVEDEDDEDEEDDKKGGDKMDDKKMSEQELTIQMRERELAAKDEALKQMSERVDALERNERRKRFTEMVLGRDGENDGRRWFGEIDHEVEFLETLADNFEDGEDNPKFVEYITKQRALAEQVHTSGLFNEKGSDSDAAGVGETANDKLRQVAKELVASGAAKTFNEAFTQAIETHPDWYKEHSDSVRFGRNA